MAESHVVSVLANKRAEMAGMIRFGHARAAPVAVGIEKSQIGNIDIPS